MKFLNYDKVLCVSPHPDDVEVGMMGSAIKYPDTHFDKLIEENKFTINLHFYYFCKLFFC